MNGCIAETHAYSLIPSTLEGSSFYENSLNETKLRDNLNAAACNVYLDKIQNAPCMRTNLKVIKGAQDEAAEKYQSRRADLDVFLK